MTIDVKRQYLNVIRAVQAACHNNNGLGIVTVRILVRGNIPLQWTEPNLTKIHPKNAASLLDIMVDGENDKEEE